MENVPQGMSALKSEVSEIPGGSLYRARTPKPINTPGLWVLREKADPGSNKRTGHKGEIRTLDIVPLKKLTLCNDSLGCAVEQKNAQ